MLALLAAEMVFMVVTEEVVVVFGAIRYLQGLMAFYICLHVLFTKSLSVHVVAGLVRKML